MLKRICVLAMFSLTPVAMARDVYLVRFHNIHGRVVLTHQAVWTNNVLLYNVNATDAVVRLLDISEGPLPPNTNTSLTLPPGRVVPLEGDVPPNSYWAPVTTTPEVPWVIHIDVPEGVVIESRNELIDDELATAEHLFARRAGKVSMPVITQLTPAGVPQVTLGTDRGTDLGVDGTRTNVMIYNDAPVAATATIEIRRACDNAVMDSRAVSIPAHSIRQFGGLQNRFGTICESGRGAPPLVRYAVVTVDQPSFTIISTLTEAADPWAGTNITPLVGLAVAINSRF